MTARASFSWMTLIGFVLAAGCGSQPELSTEDVTASAAAIFTSSPIVGVQSQRCLDINGRSTANGTQAQIWDCNGGTNQSWTYDASKTLVVYGTKCLQASGGGASNGTAVVIGDCTGQASQQWNVNTDGTITNVQSGLCMDANGAGTANGTKIILWSCGTGTNQRWTVSGTAGYTLTVTRSGTGTGTVTSTPAGVNCGSACSASYAAGTSVTLSAAASSGSTFGGWSGDCSGTSPACTVAMSAARAVTATFNPIQGTTVYLTISATGNGTTNPVPGTYTYDPGASVTVTAVPANGATFTGWSGAATGTSNPVSISMNENKTLTAIFSGAQGPGCGKTSSLKFGSVPGESGSNVGHGDGGYVTIQSSGQSRGFAMRLPDNYDRNKPYPLIFGFHWNGGNSKEVDTGGSNGYISAHFGLQKLSNNGAIFVAPDGISAGWANSGGRDMVFVDDMVKLIEDNYCVDTKHIFANGFSYGGGMSYAIACSRAKVFTGVAIYEGAVLSGCEGGNDPIAYWQMVGLEDNVCSIGMATPMRDNFVKNNGCVAQNPPQPPKAPPYLSSGGHICTSYSGCSSGHPLRWCVHQSGHGNAIVDGTGDLYNSCATPPKTCSSTCPCSWVPQDVWSFFQSL